MFLRVKKKTENRWQVQVVESARVGEKVMQKIVRNVGTAYSLKELEDFKKLGEVIIVEMKNKLKPVLSFLNPNDFHAPQKRKKPQCEKLVDVHQLREEKRINEGFTDIFSRIYDDVGFAKVFNKPSINSIIQSTVIARIADPKSKLATLKLLNIKFDIKIPFMSIYRAMDKLQSKEQEVKQIIAQKSLGLFKEKVDVLFFEVTTLYFESIIADEIKNFGFSKDCKFKEVQVVLALITTKDGLPITYELFAGNTFEGHTFTQTIEKLKSQFSVDDFVFVADRAMFSKDNLDYMEENNLKYVVAARLKSLPTKKQNEILARQSPSSNDSERPDWIEEFDHQNRRLIVSYNSKRAKKDHADRQRLIDRLVKKTNNGKIKIKELIPNYGTKKFIQVDGGEAKINDLRIEADAQWDGLHGVITNCPNEMSATKILERYRDLWQIEEAFRVNKHSLKMRPIFHWTPRRIKAHVLICFMAYTLSKYALFELKKKENISLEQLRDILEAAESTIVRDLDTSDRYVIPAKLTDQIKKTYAAFGLKRSDVPYEI